MYFPDTQTANSKALSSNTQLIQATNFPRWKRSELSHDTLSKSCFAYFSADMSKQWNCLDLQYSQLNLAAISIWSYFIA